MFKVSVVIPTYNRFARLKEVIAALERQTVRLDAFEVIVISDGSNDGTDAYLRSLTTRFALTPIFQTNSGAAAARNRGVASSRGDIILFVDDDVVPTPELIREHLRLHEAHAEDLVVLGPMLTPDGFAMLPWVRWEQAMLVKQYRAMEESQWVPTARQFYTGNSSAPREQIIAAGGFDERFSRAEDIELGFRLADRGLAFIFNPDAVGYHFAERSFGSWMMTPYQYGRCDVIFSREKGQDWLLKQVFTEFQERHPVVQGLVRACLGRKSQSAVAIYLLRCVAALSSAIGAEGASRKAYSGIFNLRHYQGVADELGGREHFFNRLS